MTGEKSEVVGETLVRVSICQRQTSGDLTLEWTHFCTVSARWLTAWAW